MVAYRDIGGKSKHFELLTEDGSFTDDVARVKEFMKGLRAIGGGDAPEDIAGALMKVRGSGSVHAHNPPRAPGTACKW